MTSFISEVTQILNNDRIPINDWIIVVPSQRSTRYIQKSIFELYQNPVLSPEIITIHTLFENISPRLILDQTRLLFGLYDIYLKHSSDKEKSFDEFFNWGKTLLNDFEEVDRYLVDARQLFKNLKDVKGIEFWSFNSEELTDTQKEFLKFWLEIGVFYEKFHEQLSQDNEAFMGMAMRELTENIDFIFRKYPDKKFLFAGFNAHSPAELSIIKQLKNMGKAEVLFDADLYYVNNPQHEAGMFIRRNMEALGVSVKDQVFKNLLSNQSIDIEIISCAQTTGQVKATASILASMSEDEINETLVLLANEDLLVPFLRNIPKKVGEANITLGLSLGNSILKTWIELIFRIQKGLLKTSSAYHKDIFEICYHPFVTEILSENEVEQLVVFEKNFKKNNLIYASVDKLDLPRRLKEIFILIYKKWEGNWSQGLSSIRQVNELVYSGLKENNEYEKALLETFDTGIIDLFNCLKEGAPEMNLATFKNLFSQHYSNLTVSYFGNPIEGLQVMGLLETRLLDFKRIICVGMNEKNLPPQNQINSLIPMDLRRFYKMALVREKQGLFAHHFYRLLHHCKKLYITFSSSVDSSEASEKSRYVSQMELEWTTVNPNVNISYRDYTIDNDEVNVEDKRIVKDETVVQLTKKYFQTGASASGLKNYYRCSLDFYYKYLLKFGEDVKIEEDIESSTFGSLIHESLQNMYGKYVNNRLDEKPQTLKKLNADELLKMERSLELELSKSFSNFFKSKEAYQSGKNKLNFEMAIHLTKGFFKYERKHIEEIGGQILVEAVEKKLECEIPTIVFDTDEGQKPLRLKGIIDRIDFHQDGYHIIDYKSGIVKPEDLKIKVNKKTGLIDVNSVYESCVKNKYVMQAYFYLYLFYKEYHQYPKSISFISFVTSDAQTLTESNVPFEELIRIFPDVLKKITDEILDSSKPYQHDVKNTYADYCDFCH